MFGNIFFFAYVNGFIILNFTIIFNTVVKNFLLKFNNKVSVEYRIP